MLINGNQLTDRQRAQVLAVFVHRHLDTTSANDTEWVHKHAFHFVKDGSRLHGTRNYAEPAFVAGR